MTEKNCVYLLNTLAAKFDGKESWLPFPMHLADTAGVMEWLTTHWLPDHVTETIMEKNPQIELNKLCKFIALVHDIGKVTPVFQSKICEGSGYLKERIAALGIDVPPFSSFISRSKTPHSFAGEAILLRAGCPKGIAAVVGAHHGEPYTDTEADEEDDHDQKEAAGREGDFGLHGVIRSSVLALSLSRLAGASATMIWLRSMSRSSECAAMRRSRMIQRLVMALA